ncbi:2-hydroxyacid dehydrogenase [Streptomyces sp. JJ38]|uniref:2-hydroxyacid dehydrogenase n=1 Tax=Streptomyces sp. JJ38 TaxID=2738128 RepID=UPI001C5663F9|nr:2-hydroxyacid dehydrogenase [Streptomyces sp. JJ38]MBW1598271.1 2-hydroxyacid dehydrogenase [Streptomyces sp. JJ38]
MSATDVWLPLPLDEFDDLPGAFTYRYWNADSPYPADPADCLAYVVPYLKPAADVLAPLERMRSVRLVQTLTAGTEHMLPGLAALPPGAALCNAVGVHDASTAELALTLILASLRGVPDFVRQQDAGRWRGGFRPALADRRVLIVGYGGIGRAVEERLLPFEVARVDRVARTARAERHGPVQSLDALPTLLPEADVVVVAVPLTEGTRHLVDGGFLARMPDGALLVNVARGGVVDTKALLPELESGRLRAALDVTDPEPLPEDHPLWRAPGVLITPHVGGPSTAFRPRARALVRAQLDRLAAGEHPAHVVHRAA